MNIQVASSMTSRLRGLFGRADFKGALLLTPCNDVHTFGMRRAIDVAFITPTGLVVESHRNVPACRRLRCKQASSTLERFSTAGPWYKRGDRVELKNIRYE